MGLIMSKYSEDYKVECEPPEGLPYVTNSFEVFFSKEEYMFDFMDIVPRSYNTKHYEKNHDTKQWELICEIQGWRDCDDG